MSADLLVVSCPVEVDVVDIGPQLFNLSLGNIEAKFAFRLGQNHP